ncbi:MAG: hypothetical protein AB8G99_13930, partial [Planctomycetaceae bacterium]
TSCKCVMGEENVMPKKLLPRPARLPGALCMFVVLVVLANPAISQEKMIEARDLLGINGSKIRKDNFAAVKAMAERYSVSVRVRLEKQIGRLDAYCGLSDKQRRRLELATLGSAKTVGKRYLKRLLDTERIEGDEEAVKQITLLRDEVQQSLSSPEKTSFWLKSVESTLTDDQKEELAKNRAARLAFQKRAWVLRAVDEIDSEILLLIDQREQLVKIFEKWIAENPIPTMARGRRAAWKMFPEDLVPSLIFPHLDEKRSRALVTVAPHHLRERLLKTLVQTK